MHDDEDRDLRELFARLRADDKAAARPFQAVVNEARRRRRSREPGGLRRVAALAAILLLLAGGAVMVLSRQPHPGRRGPPAALVRLDLRSTWWTAPTDFLLDTPGDRLLRTLPDLGPTDDWGLAPGHARTTTPRTPLRDGRRTS
jgi:hypothetical protein